MFIEVETKKLVSYEDIKRQFQNISFGLNIDVEFLKTLGFEVVLTDNYPSDIPFGSAVVRSEPFLDGTTWRRTYSITNLEDTFVEFVDEQNNTVTIAQQVAIMLEDTKRQMLTHLAAERFKFETKGIIVNGTMFSTSRENQSTITSIYSASIINPAIVIDWKTSDGWIKLNATQINEVAQAVAEHVQRSFSIEKTVHELINAASTFAELRAIDFSAHFIEV
ncbi:MAG: DUF4376 domain-containing protein [Candidatus Nitrosotenuis sp.]